MQTPDAAAFPSSSSSASPAPLFHNPVIRFRLPTSKCHPNAHKFPTTTFPFLLHLLFLVLAVPPSTRAATKTNNPIPYSKYCNDVVPESSPSPIPLTDPLALTLSETIQLAYPSGKSGATPPQVNYGSDVVFRSTKAFKTQNDGVFKLDGGLSLPNFRYQELARRRWCITGHPRFLWALTLVGGHFSLGGFWNSTSGNLCVVGPGSERRHSSIFGVVKLNFPDKSSIFNSFINGTFEIYNLNGGRLVETLIILGVNPRNYEFRLIDKEMGANVFQHLSHFSNVSLGLEGTMSCVG